MQRNRVVVSSADFIRNIGHWQNEALRQPLSITHHGRERLVLSTPDQFQSDAGDQHERADAELRAAFAALSESLEEAYFGLDGLMRVCAVNCVAEAMTGQDRESLQGRRVTDVLPDPLASVLGERVQRVLRTRKSETFECGAFDGRHMLARVFPTTHGAGALLLNATELQVLRRRQEDVAALEAAASALGQVALIKLDVHGRIENVNATFCARTGFAGEDLVGHRLADLTSTGARRDLMTSFERVMREGAPQQMALRLLGKRGDEIEGQLALAPILTDFVARGAHGVWTLQAEPAPRPAA